jgi:hypothetical protein
VETPTGVEERIVVANPLPELFQGRNRKPGR